LTHTWAPVRLASSGQACCGVGGTIVRTMGSAASNSSSEKSGIGAPSLIVRKSREVQQRALR
jgi:hypothetical protein